MSIEFVKQEIQDFLATKDADVACLSGHWGVGKTYAWREFLTKAKTEKKIALPRYAYVSLFGIN
jgi:tRNA A37 threonylcarbamoyladenosine biosynthesis protein TsaE